MSENSKPASEPAEDTLSLCCGGKKCPEFTAKNGGISITDSEKLSGESIELDAEQATRLRAWLQRRGY